MTPYFEGSRATLYLGDARDVLPVLSKDSIDLLVTDPPYGIGFRSGIRTEAFDYMAGDRGETDVVGILAQAATVSLREGRHVYVFGYKPADLAEPLKLGGTAELVWDKGMLGMGDLTLPWAASWERITFGVHVASKASRAAGDGRLSARLRSGAVLCVPRRNSRQNHRHPTEKPVALMARLVESSSVIGEVVLDPFAGSGSTLVAAVLRGRRAIGIEISEQYAEVAATRLREAERLTAEAEAV